MTPRITGRAWIGSFIANACGGAGCAVGPLGAPDAAFARGLHGDYGLCVQVRTVPMVTGMMSLTSTVNW